MVDHCGPFYDGPVAQQVANVYSLDLALGDNMNSPIVGVALGAGAVKKFHSITIQNGRIQDWTLFGHLLSQTPRVEQLESTWLNGVCFSGQRRRSGFVCSLHQRMSRSIGILEYLPIMRNDNPCRARLTAIARPKGPANPC